MCLNHKQIHPPTYKHLFRESAYKWGGVFVDALLLIYSSKQSGIVNYFFRCDCEVAIEKFVIPKRPAISIAVTTA